LNVKTEEMEKGYSKIENILKLFFGRGRGE